ncbi:hypothetical protein KW787_01970 [Candidatus Pacearchaeota archaeon]|nr:hypothetical protein [Candidatus Pacearchaeota archaeon]
MKGQSAIEFVIVVSAALFFLLAFTVAVQVNIENSLNEKRERMLKEIAVDLQDEVALASGSTDGYYREFTIPTAVFDRDYSASFVAGYVYVVTNDTKHAIAIKILNVTGNPVPGKNSIRRTNGSVYVNS